VRQASGSSAEEPDFEAGCFFKWLAAGVEFQVAVALKLRLSLNIVAGVKRPSKRYGTNFPPASRCEFFSPTLEVTGKKSMEDQTTPQKSQTVTSVPTSTNVIPFSQLAHGAREVIIEHEGQVYRLRLTRNGKLILNK